MKEDIQMTNMHMKRWFMFLVSTDISYHYACNKMTITSWRGCEEIGIFQHC